MSVLTWIPSEAWVVLLTAIPVLAVAGWGYRLGLATLSARIFRTLLIWCAGSAATFGTLRAGYFEPFGLLTPLAAGVVASGVAFLALGRLRAPVQLRALEPTVPRRLAGATLGGAVGFGAATVAWISASLIVSASKSLPDSESEQPVATYGSANISDAQGLPGEHDLASSELSIRDPAEENRLEPQNSTLTAGDHASAEPARSSFSEWTQAIVSTANRGFVRHLPVVGEYGNELDGLVTVLNSSPSTKRRLVERHELAALTDIPAYQELLEDGPFWRSVEAVAHGDITALYHLQRNGNIIEFMTDERVQSAVRKLRPSQLAREVEALEGSSP